VWDSVLFIHGLKKNLFFSNLYIVTIVPDHSDLRFDTVLGRNHWFLSVELFSAV